MLCNAQKYIAADVLSEEVILKWYKDSHSSRGWSVFMDQMKKFVEWLEHAEEGEWDYKSFHKLPACACLSLFVFVGRRGLLQGVPGGI